MIIRPSGRVWTWLLTKAGFAGVAIPFVRRVYILPKYIGDHRLRHHELIHIAQMRRDGDLWWTLRCMYYLAYYGYKRSPYELEAYRRADPDTYRALYGVSP